MDWDRGYSILGLGINGYGDFFNMWKHLNVGFRKEVVFKLKLLRCAVHIKRLVLEVVSYLLEGLRVLLKHI